MKQKTTTLILAILLLISCAKQVEKSELELEAELEDESPEAPFYLQLFKRDHVLDGVCVLNLMVIIRARAIG